MNQELPPNDMTGAASHSKLPIERRRVKFDFSDIEDKYFYGGNPQVSAFFAGLSVSFPPGEGEFIKSVKLFEDQITDERLKTEVKNFAHQEAHHSLQHKMLNKRLVELGYDIAVVEKIMQQKLSEREQNWSPARRLARTVAAEHVTATWANWSLQNEKRMAQFPTSLRHMLQCHAIEEIEHKSVAFDVYKHCVDNQLLLNWEFRLFLYYEFPLSLTLMTRGLLKKQGYKATREDRAVFKDFLFSKEDGMVTSLMPHFRAFTKRGFHPWALDDSGLVGDWKSELAPYFAH